MNDTDLKRLFEVGQTLTSPSLQTRNCNGDFVVILLGFLYKRLDRKPPALIYVSGDGKIMIEHKRGRSLMVLRDGHDILLIDPVNEMERLVMPEPAFVEMPVARRVFA